MPFIQIVFFKETIFFDKSPEGNADSKVSLPAYPLYDERLIEYVPSNWRHLSVTI